jgi:cytochrome c-type biogenesis protein CcmF
MAIEPDLSSLQPIVRDADRRFANARPDVQAFLIAAVAARYERHPPPATFRIIVSPLVSWIWLGALVVFAGALIALWPARLAVRRRVTAGYGARVSRELGRA